jgi:hypothetical protein
MRNVLFLLLVCMAVGSSAQITIDTTKTTVTVREKTAAGVKTMTIYKTYVPGVGMRNQIVYQPTAAEFGEEPPTLGLSFTAELPHIKNMLDAAIKRKQFNFSRFSINILPYNDLTAKLANVYIASVEWNDYIKKGGLMRATTLTDGTEVSEFTYDPRRANYVFERSDFMKELSAFFAPYGYKVSSGGFPDDHQPTMEPEKLVQMGKASNLVVPLPNNYFTLTKIK